MKPKTVTAERIRELLEFDITSYGGVRKLAKRLKLSPAHVSDVRHGKRHPGPTVLRHLGLRKVVTITYEPVTP